jgi:uncharacterized membrane protein YqaE (UPF0057 family)
MLLPDKEENKLFKSNLMKLKSTFFGLVVLALLASCSTGNDVVSGRSIQKRKYNDGYYISSNNKFKNKATAEKTEAVATIENATAQSNEFVQPANTPSEAPVLLTEANSTPAIPAGTANTNQVTETTDEVTNADHSIAQPLDLNKKKQKTGFKPGRISAPKMIQSVTDSGSAADADVMLILLIILALFLPWLSVLIFEGATGRFWITLILWLIGIGVGYWLFGGGLAWICGLVAVIYAILILLGVI